MEDFISPDDQLARLKAWWKQYGKALIAGVLLGALLLTGINAWKHYRTKQAEAASLVYDALLADFQQGKADAVASAATKLEQDYAATPYAGKAALLLARLRFDAKDTAGARQQLEWAMNNAREDAVRHSARLRLGHILLDRRDADGALALTQAKDTGGFAAEYQELRGDTLLAKNDRAGARAAYQAALDGLPAGSPYAGLLAMKRDSLGAERVP